METPFPMGRERSELVSSIVGTERRTLRAQTSRVRDRLVVRLARLAGGMQAPMSTLASLFAAPLRNLGYALQQVADQKAAAPGA